MSACLFWLVRDADGQYCIFDRLPVWNSDYGQWWIDPELASPVFYDLPDDLVLSILGEDRFRSFSHSDGPLLLSLGLASE